MAAQPSLLRGIAWIASLTLVVNLAVVYCLTPLLPLALFAPTRPAFRWWSRWAMRLFYGFSAIVTEGLGGTRIVLSGDPLPRPGDDGDRRLSISNHNCRVDWMYLGWSLGMRCGSLGHLRIVLKEGLKQLPGYGWGMQCFAYIYLARSGKGSDLDWMSRVLRIYNRMAEGTNLLIFPEGTDLSKHNLERSRAFCASKGVSPPFERVLYPRTAGFVTCVRELSPSFQAVYDYTVAYVADERPSERSMIAGIFPREVHIHVKRHSMRSLPVEEAALKAWCVDRFAAKERMLAAFDGRHLGGVEAARPPVGRGVGEQTMILLALLGLLVGVWSSLGSWTGKLYVARSVHAAVPPFRNLRRLNLMALHPRLCGPSADALRRYPLVVSVAWWCVSRYTKGIDRLLVTLEEGQ